jgi:hypothetical protein
MRNHLCYAIVMLIGLVALNVGCSSTNPTVPDSYNSNETPGISMNESDGFFSASGLLGAYTLTVDPDNLSAELVPVRTSSIGESYLISGLAYFTLSPCSTCLTLTGIHLNPSGSVALSFNLKHPFQPGDTGLPPKANNRRDLDIFDVAAVIVPTTGLPSRVFAFGFDSLYEGFVEDPDGYTLDIFELDLNSAAMPYVLVIDENDESPIPSPKKFNKFAMGTNKDFDINLNLTTTPFVYDMYLTFGYGAAAKKATFLQPKYYNPEFNRKSAWKVVVTPPEGNDPPSSSNTWLSTDNTTTKIVRVEVYDWQTGAVQTSLADFALEPDTTKVLESSEVSGVKIEILGMTADWVSSSIPTGTGMPGDPLVFNVSIANQNSLPAGTYPGLVTVVDERQIGDPQIDNHDILIHTDNGITLSYFAIPAYQTQQFFIATVVDP